MPVYRVCAIKEGMEGEDLFPTYGFMYFLEDMFLSLKMWNKGYKSIVIPTVCGEHFRQTTIRKYKKNVCLNYYIYKNIIALLKMTNCRRIMKILKYLVFIRRAVLSRLNKETRKEIILGIFNGIKLGRKLRRTYGVIDLWKAPIYKVEIGKVIKQIIPRIP